MGSLLIWALVCGLISQNMVVAVYSARVVDDQKNYYYFSPPDPSTGTPPTGSQTPPSSGGSSGGTPPSHGTPLHGGSSGGHHKPPCSCANPPKGGHHAPTPKPPTGAGGSGGYQPSPSTGGSPPTAPTTPSTPLTPPIVNPPTIVSPPTNPAAPDTPSIPPVDPNSPTTGGTCDYWRTHPGLMWGLFGWWGTVGGAFGATTLPGFGASMSLRDALSNTGADGVGELYREGTASLLNSMVNKAFPFTTSQVRDSFVTSLGSDMAAEAQARLFKMANEGRLKLQA